MLKKIALFAASAALVLSATSSFADTASVKCVMDPWPADVKADGQTSVDGKMKSYVLKDSKETCMNAGGTVVSE